MWAHLFCFNQSIENVESAVSRGSKKYMNLRVISVDGHPVQLHLISSALIAIVLLLFLMDVDGYLPVHVAI